MCTASLEKGYFWNSAIKKNNASQKQQHVSFIMKLPLFSKKDVPDNDENNDISRDQECNEGMEAATMRQQAQCTWGAPPSQNATYNYGGGMRRVQSANASRPRGAVGAASGRNTPLETAHKSRSHSQEARTTRDANAVYEVVAPPPPSEQLPIPQCKNTLLEIARTKSDQTDLRRMYDYATWNMYDRIVSARNKKRMSLEADNSDDLDTPHKEGEKESSSSSAASKNTDKPSSSATTTATTSCNSSFTSSPNNNQLAAIACKGPGITKTSGNNNNKTTATIKKVQASTSSNTSNTASASAATTTATSSTQAMSTASIYKQQAAATTSSSNMNATQTSLHHKLRSIKKSFSSHDTDSSQGGTAATESTSLESEDSSGSSRSGCNSPATFPGCMVSAGRSSETSQRKLSQGSEDDHFIFQMDM